jgi:hypothetical protein
VEFIFRTVNCAKNYIKRFCLITQHYILKVYKGFILTQSSIPVYQLRETPHQFPNSGYQLRNPASQNWNSAFQWRKTCHQLGKFTYQLGKTASQWRKFAYQCMKTAYQLRKTASQWRKSGHHWGKSLSGNIILIEFLTWQADILRTRQPILMINKIQLLTRKF